ncbi:competence protein CoiA family protein [Kitasatospora sp. NPDC085879]|uniref:competence protein CoiA family protein n=1 Tax=Kitasatospora sp. NPDC085879 TaxID=3154769 RepID=UPI000BB1153A|nr:competence protein CoiA family protein [Streptomyces sp. TLI_235]PBC69727.1 competence protein CoiA-like protein [Streptomyces sp. TLI_235]
MAFTAIHPAAGRLDATLPDLGAGLQWADVHKARPRIALRCPECGHDVHAKCSPKGLRFFAHGRRRPDECELAGESMEHHLLKLELAQAVRAGGWHAELEVAAPDGSWRADVMATSPDGRRRTAWEAQLSPITVEDLEARTARYAGAGIGVCWVTDRRAVPWMGKVPSVRVSVDDGGRWGVDDGVAGFEARAGGWAVQLCGLAQFVAWVHSGRVAGHRVLPRYRGSVDLAVERRTANRPVVWTTPRSIAAEAEHDRRRRREDEARREQELARQARAVEARRLLREQEEEAERESQARRVAVQAYLARQRRRHEVYREYNQRQADLDRLVRRGRAAVQRLKDEVLRRERELAGQEAERQLEAARAAELSAAQSWWKRLTPAQCEELADSVNRQAWKETAARAETGLGEIAPQFAYGWPARTVGRRRGLYGIVRPCPAFVARCPQLLTMRVFVRNAREARELAAAGLDPARITHFDLADHEQDTLC